MPLSYLRSLHCLSAARLKAQSFLIDGEVVIVRDGMKAAISMVFSDSNEVWALELSNSVLNSTRGRVLKNPDVTITLTQPAFLAMLLQGKKLPELVQAGMVKVEGNPQSFGAVVANIMTSTRSSTSSHLKGAASTYVASVKLFPGPGIKNRGAVDV